MPSPITAAIPIKLSADGLFERLLRANHDAFFLSRFNTAYHALAAAMHEAKEERQTERLEQVALLAEEQLVWIDANASADEHSTTSCLHRHSTSLYTLLAQQARTNERLLSRAVGAK